MCGGLKIPSRDGKYGFVISLDVEQFTSRNKSSAKAKEKAAIKTLLNTKYCFRELPVEFEKHMKLDLQGKVQPVEEREVKSDTASDSSCIMQTQSPANLSTTTSKVRVSIKDNYDNNMLEGISHTLWDDSVTKLQEEESLHVEDEVKCQPSQHVDKSFENALVVDTDAKNPKVQQTGKFRQTFVPLTRETENQDVSDLKQAEAKTSVNPNNSRESKKVTGGTLERKENVEISSIQNSCNLAGSTGKVSECYKEKENTSTAGGTTQIENESSPILSKEPTKTGGVSAKKVKPSTQGRLFIPRSVLVDKKRTPPITKSSSKQIQSKGSDQTKPEVEVSSPCMEVNVNQNDVDDLHTEPKIQVGTNFY